MQAVAGLGAVADKTTAMREKRVQFTHLGWWHPDLGDQLGGQQAREVDCIARVGFDACSRDQFDQEWVCDRVYLSIGNLTT